MGEYACVREMCVCVCVVAQYTPRAQGMFLSVQLDRPRATRAQPDGQRLGAR
jgi:hypothetical protein